jgi:hypothetical protein
LTFVIRTWVAAKAEPVVSNATIEIFDHARIGN